MAIAAKTQLKFQQALSCHQQDKLVEAENLYKAVLAEHPEHFDATHLLGVLAFQTGCLQKAVELIKRAIRLNGTMAEAHSNLGNVLMDLKRFEEALASYDNATALKPNLPEMHNNRGGALNALKRFDEALVSYDRATVIRPDYPEAYNNQGNTLAELKRFDEALVSYYKAIKLKPDYAEVYSNFGNTLSKLERFEEALLSYGRAIVLLPDLPEPYNNQGTAFRNLLRLDEALASYDKAILLKPDYAEAHRNRGIVLTDLKHFDEAMTSFDAALSLTPDDAESHYSRGMPLTELRRLEEALASYDRAIALKPDYAEAYNNRGIILADMKRIEEALASYDKATSLNANWPEAHSNKSLSLLLAGRFEAGWPLYEWRKKKPELAKLFAARSHFQPLWHGPEDIAGKTLFIYWEQALGDTIQFCRYLKCAEALGATIVFSAQNCLHELLTTLSPSIRLIAEHATPHHFDYHSPLMSLPLAFKTGLKTIPAVTPYLHAERQRIGKWRDRLGNEGFKIGIVWQGSTGKIDTGRSFPLEAFDFISRIPTVRLISLQKGDGCEQLDQLPQGMRIENLGDDYDSSGNAFLDAAAVMEIMDLVITSDTAIAHLAGALGRPVWVALKAVPDWRWLQDRRDSPWYPGMRLFRQRTSGDWHGVFSDMAAELPALIARQKLLLKP